MTDESLSRCIYELRRQLSLAGGDERYKAMLETVPKRGYRLNAEVTPLAPEPDVRATTQPKWPLVAVAAAIVVAVAAWFALGQRPDDASSYSVAVLPFDDLSSEQDQAHFSDGVSEEIINRLKKTRALQKVTSRKSSFSFRGEATSIPEIATKLDVTHVLEGSVRKSGNRVRITARLIEASDNSQVWSKTYDRELGDLFAVQDEIAGEVATALNATLSGHPEHAPILEAQNLFQQGQLFYNRLAPGDIELSVKYYKDALAIDPKYARAWAALAGAYSLPRRPTATCPRRRRWRNRVRRRAGPSTSIPRLAAGHARLAQYYFDIGDRRTSYRIFDKAIALDPDDLLVLIFAAGIAMRNGDTAEAIGRYGRIVALDPLSATYHANHGIYLLAADRFDEAKAELQEGAGTQHGLRWEFDLAIARILVLQKQFDEARSVIARLLG